jgi:predicted nucleic acid-binding protein
VKVLVDTPIWSLSFRRKKKDESSQDTLLVLELTKLIREIRAVIIGPIRQEILSGVSSESQFERLRTELQVFEDLKITSLDYEIAAKFYNMCRKKGVQGSHIDFLICAVSYRHNIPIFTTDRDFDLYSKHLDISLYKPRISVS